MTLHTAATTRPRRAGHIHTALASITVGLLILTGCSTTPPSATGTIVDLHLTGATVKHRCNTVSTVPYTEDCNRVRIPDRCYAYIQTPDGGYVQAELWCDAYDTLHIGDHFTDGTTVKNSYCAYKDSNGRWQAIAGTNTCADYKDHQ